MGVDSNVLSPYKKKEYSDVVAAKLVSYRTVHNYRPSDITTLLFLAAHAQIDDCNVHLSIWHPKQRTNFFCLRRESLVEEFGTNSARLIMPYQEKVTFPKQEESIKAVEKVIGVADMEQNRAGRSRFVRVCVFCGSSAGKRDCYRDAAAALGRELVTQFQEPSLASSSLIVLSSGEPWDAGGQER